MVSVNQRSHHWGGTTLWVLPEMAPKWMVLEDPTKKDDLLVPPFQDTSIYIYIECINEDIIGIWDLTMNNVSVW